MIDIRTVFTTTASLCLLLLPGFLFGKLKLTEGRGFAKGISDFVLYAAQPAMLVTPYIREFDSGVLKNAGFTVLFSLICHGLFTAAAIIVIRAKRSGTEPSAEDPEKAEKKRKNLSTVRIAAIFGNCGYMGIPLIENLLGSEAAIYATVFNIGFQLFLWTGREGDGVIKVQSVHAGIRQHPLWAKHSPRLRGPSHETTQKKNL